MNALLLLLTLLGPVQSEFSTFSFCREGLGGADERWCVELDASGEGTFSFDSADGGQVEEPLVLTEGVAETFVGLLAATDYLREGDQYESDRKVANLGRKTMVADGPWGRREATFNYSDRKEVGNLVSFLEKLIGQEMLLVELDVALQFDRLAIPRKLDELERNLKANRVADAQRLVPMLDRIAQDSRLVNFARTRATRLKEQIEQNY